MLKPTDQSTTVTAMPEQTGRLAPLNEDEVFEEKVVREAAQSKKPPILVEKMFSLANMYYRNSAEELCFYWVQTAKQYKLLESKSSNAHDFLKKVKSWLRSRLDKEQKKISDFNKDIEALRKRKIVAPFPVRTNKIAEIISGSVTLIERYAPQLFKKDPIPGYNIEYKEKDIPFLSKHFWGSSRATYLKYTVMMTYTHLLGVSFEELPSLKDETSKKRWIDVSDNAFLTPIPAELDIRPYRDCSFIFHDVNTSKHMLLAFHNFYAFGGTRECDQVSESFPEAPTDCSEVISRVTGIDDISFTTADPLRAQYAFLEKNTREASIVEWKETPLAKKMNEMFEVIPADPAQIRPGDIMNYRRVKAGKGSDIIGESGHIGVVLALTRKEKEVVTISCSRDMEKEIEGIGIKNFPAQSCQFPAYRHEVTYLRLREKKPQEKVSPPLDPWSVALQIEQVENALHVSLVTDDLIIRSLKAEDKNHCIRLFGDSIVMEKFASGRRYNEESAASRLKDWLKRWRNNDPFSGYAVFKKVPEQFIGVFVLEYSGQPGEAEVAYALHHPIWRQGYGSKVADAMFNVLVPQLIERGYKLGGQPLETIVATAREDNMSFRAILHKSEFTGGTEPILKYGYNRFFFQVSAEKLQKKYQDRCAEYGKKLQKG